MAARRIILGGLLLAASAFGATAQEPRNPPPVAGAYGALGPVDDEAKAVFEQATAGLQDVQYAPLTVSRQVVSGMNFRFIANAQAKTEGAPTTLVRIIIYKPLSGEPSVTKIEPLP
jgi:hypothetical protein